MTKIFLAASKNTTEVLYGDADLDLKGYVNQYGLSRKVTVFILSISICCLSLIRTQHIFDAVKHSLRRPWTTLMSYNVRTVFTHPVVDTQSTQVTVSIPIPPSRRR
jgi:hypothetical protein